uniref:site-specific integrase n=1 Tax=Nonomuraea pusilla TaxID=46177 RepID=UPI0006E29FB9|nr:site-specific integrase [Nonomuraea pusilla]
MGPVIAEQLGRAHPLAAHLNDFLTDLANAGRSTHTRRAYRGDLIAFAAHHGEEIGALPAAPVRAFLAELAGLSPASRRRKGAAVAAFGEDQTGFWRQAKTAGDLVLPSQIGMRYLDTLDVVLGEQPTAAPVTPGAYLR